MSTDKPKTSMESINHLLKDVYEDKLNEQLKRDNLFFGRPEFNPAPYKPSFKEKWNTFWDHVPDFFSYLREYKYNTWRYWDKDGY